MDKNLFLFILGAVSEHFYVFNYMQDSRVYANRIYTKIHRVAKNNAPIDASFSDFEAELARKCKILFKETIL